MPEVARSAAGGNYIVGVWGRSTVCREVENFKLAIFYFAKFIILSCHNLSEVSQEKRIM